MFAVSLMFLGCDSHETTQPVIPAGESLIDHSRWKIVHNSVGDPFKDYLTNESDFCETHDYHIEQTGEALALEVSTRQCNYLSLSQPTELAIAAGNQIQIRVWHQELQSPTPSEGHLAIRIGTTTVWQHSVAIPAESGLIEAIVPASKDESVGTPLYFHLDNHGVNTWSLLSVNRLN